MLALAGVAAALWLATPALIVPFPQQAPWYESAAFFPRAALALALSGALAEWLRRRRAEALAAGDSDELDSSAARLPLALGLLALFIAYALLVPVLGLFSASVLYLVACGAVLRLPWRVSCLLALPLSLLLWLVFVRLLKVAFGHGWWF